MKVQEFISNTCGLYHVPLLDAMILQPQLPCWKTLPDVELDEYICDIKKHMLMPKQYPCIPNWHRDFVPRNEELKECLELIDPKAQMFFWLSGPPFTEFKDGRKIEANKWIKFTQNDLHRGRPSANHCERTFVRIAPLSIMKQAGVGDVPARQEKWIRTHTQVYLDAANFKW